MHLVIRTERLELVAGNAHSVRAEMSDRIRLSEILDAEIPANWPPELNDLRMKELSIRWFENHPSDPGWLCWYFILVEGQRRALIGIGGFSDVPDASGAVEVGYSILPEHQRHGFATEAVRGLVAWAFLHPEVRSVLAEIHPGYEASARVLEKAGFCRIESDLSTDVAVYAVTRPGA